MEPEVTTTQSPADDLAGLDANLFTDTTPTANSNAAPVATEPTSVFKVGDRDVAKDDLIKAYQDMQNLNNWQAQQTQKSQVLAEQERALNQRQQDLQAYEQSLYNSRLQQQTPTIQHNGNGNGQYQSQVDLDSLDPATKAIYQQVMELRQITEADRKARETNEFAMRVQRDHEQLRQRYGDYEPTTIERSIMQGRNQFEDVYLAEQFKQLKSGDERAIRSLIPKQLLDNITKEVRTQIINEAKSKQLQRNNISTITPGKSAPVSAIVPDAKPKDFNEARDRTLQFLQGSNLSLIDNT